MEVNFKLYASGNNSGTQRKAGRLVSRAGVDGFRDEKNLSPLAEFEPRFLQSLAYSHFGDERRNDNNDVRCYTD